MALKDLVSDLSNFKGQSQYDDLDGQIKNGVDFIPNTDAPGFTPKTDLESLYDKVKNGNVVAPRSHGGTYFANIFAPRPVSSQFVSPNKRSADNISITPEGFKGVKQSLVLPREVSRIVEGQPLFDTFNNLESGGLNTITLKKEYGENQNIKDLLKFDKKGKNTYPNVPNGINENGKFGTADFRKVANKGPFSGNDNHPLILRGIGNKWGIDANDGLLQTLDQVAGGFVRGAPGITGLVDRSLQDKVRIGRFMFTTNLGLSFIVKQFALQALNPTLESKIWNPASALSLTGVGDIISGLVSTAQGGGRPSNADLLSAAQSAAISAAFPIGHPERHLGGIKYEDVNPLDRLEPDEGLGKKIKSIPVVGNTLFNKINDKIDEVGGFSRLGAQASMEIAGVEIPLKDRMLMMNPNKYLFPISSAPMSVVDGVPKFTIEAGSGNGSAAQVEATKVESKAGGTFNKNSGLITRVNDIVTHASLPYNELGAIDNYEKELRTYAQMSPSTSRSQETTAFSTKRETEKITLEKIGKYNSNDLPVDNDTLGMTKGNPLSDNVDKVNIIPYGSNANGDIPTEHKSTQDFIKFRFHDIVNKKWIIFRAILEGVSDSISPEYNEERYIGRPDKIYTYQGVDRNISFGFSIYPKTKQELPVLMDKLNYLVGLCYPSFTAEDRMVTPFIDLTIGDMFVGTPGVLSSLTVSVEDSSTWEIDESLQFPHFIKAQCEFKHIGKHVPVSTGRHYDLRWLPNEDKQIQADRFTNDKIFAYNQYPSRAKNYRDDIFGPLGQPNE